jgi:hypothetical protein
MSLRIIAIVTTVKILMSVSHVTIVVNVVLYPLQLTTKIIVTTTRNRTNIHNVIESNQLMDLIPKALISKIESLIGDRSHAYIIDVINWVLKS